MSQELPDLASVPPVLWDEKARRAIERMSIYQRERLRQRAEERAREEDKTTITLADLERAQSQASAMMAARRQPAATKWQPSPPWPVSFGSYLVGDVQGSVAICTLASEELAWQLGTPSGVAIVGRAYTENLGVEKMVRNLVSNARIRFLLLCGPESRHKVGQTVTALHTNGVDEKGRVIGSEGPLPYIKGLPPEAIAIFQEQVDIIDLIEETDRAHIHEIVAGCVAQARPALPRHWLPATPIIQAEEISPTTARPEDPAGFLLVGTGPYRDRIHMEHYDLSGTLTQTVVGESAEAVCRAVLVKGLITELSHAIYLGREAQKAELALRMGWRYEQDRPLIMT